ncbi:hypothetical protein VKT23_004786 [Stygiomarasmius scandens]|uniref:Uncharacterized protein n=1 Tax=Marasmiellus scandens TaxID=2682957 RepID=A0ABR1JRC9_9AGAR
MSHWFSNAQYLTFTRCQFYAAQNINNSTITNTAVQPGDFRTVPLGDIKLLQPVVHSQKIDIPIYDGSSILQRLKPTNPFRLLLERKTVQVVRTVYTARLLTATGLNSETFTVITYGSIGRDAEDGFLAWKREYEYYAKIRHANVLQLFGITPSMHALIYHEVTIEDVYCFAPELFKGELYTSQWLYNPKSQSFSLSFINTQDYEIVPGARGPYFSDQFGEGRTLAGIRIYESPPRALEDESSIINMVSRMASDYLKTIAWIGLKEWVVEFREQEIIPFGTVISKSSPESLGCIMGRLPLSPTEMPQWRFLTTHSVWPTLAQYQLDQLPGTLKFRLAFPAHQRLEGTMLLRFSLTFPFEDRINLRAAFLSQCFPFLYKTKTECVFVDYAQVAMSAHISLQSLPRPIYFFVLPMRPQIIDEIMHIPWPRAESFSYWSFDAAGNCPLAQEEYSYFGVPKLDFSVAVGTQWNDRHYGAVKKYLEFKGYDLFSKQYAEEHGYPIIDDEEDGVEMCTVCTRGVERNNAPQCVVDGCRLPIDIIFRSKLDSPRDYGSHHSILRLYAPRLPHEDIDNVTRTFTSSDMLPVLKTRNIRPEILELFFNYYLHNQPMPGLERQSVATLVALKNAMNEFGNQIALREIASIGSSLL